MILERPLALNLTDLERVTSGYFSEGKHAVLYTSTEDQVSFYLQPVTLRYGSFIQQRLIAIWTLASS